MIEKGQRTTERVGWLLLAPHERQRQVVSKWGLDPTNFVTVRVVCPASHKFRWRWTDGAIPPEPILLKLGRREDEADARAAQLEPHPG